MNFRKAVVLGMMVGLVGCGGTEEPTQSPDVPTEIGANQLVTTESGLKYHDLKVGDGVEAVKGKRVTVHYTGWLTSGEKFDSSVDKQKPFSFLLGGAQVIAGWDEGVAGMKVGGKRQLVIPSGLGYGDAGYPPVIPEKATLVFEVELLKVE
jgi:FKBP-type peptidyl-prolyl cis-trans isomerase FkpA